MLAMLTLARLMLAMLTLARLTLAISVLFFYVFRLVVSQPF